jgi:deoxyribose-phosphate aldolase
MRSSVPQQPPAGLERNPGMPLDLGWVRDIRVNRSAVERRAATLVTRRTVKQDWQVAWQLRAITLMDLTTLQGDDTPGRVRRLCAKARRPVRQDLLQALGAGELSITVAAVCVYHAFLDTARRALEGSGIPVAVVSTGFPAGLSPLPTTSSPATGKLCSPRCGRSARPVVRPISRPSWAPAS